ncbi:molybdenum cofactor guanylyltransferase [Pseudomonas agarici]|uniref:Molybdenum cofactor guanylyltransferase n=1 Tax=Pseudomonas agarici TaxID=46677 RepID=A0A0X1T0V8_PSEAA|nr:molybdenum cofactor guanylyltransferase MobA [Pseudomonas agarici]AMB85694.1 molybdenum cofactor guanylyltransferase [Pseudomonas agarici]NWB91021.1 molybdenum cofactor guanylyltransferase MobA [Pseudomonas agarici]NWC09616.1 molybdenum cofactor guanylyltransferase MobA [Pseudomonas agarici]SEL21861.1 molybdenum cofactor guanylyltransferase [Pseudomonas agarici]
MSLIKVSIVVLAGGRGQRMGGQDKGLLEWRGRPLIAHLHATARTLTDDLVISCNRNSQRYAIYADRLVADDSDDFPGPLAGIRAALAVARHSHLLVLPCDVPRVDRNLLQAMIDAAGQHPEQPLMVRQGEHWEPLLCVIPVALAGAFERAWASGERSPRKVMLPLQALALQCPANDPRLANLNTAQLLEHGDNPPDGHRRGTC